jgi:hypothetical protein
MVRAKSRRVLRAERLFTIGHWKRHREALRHKHMARPLDEEEQQALELFLREGYEGHAT